jgi:nitrite reductase (NADH) small subunit
MAELFVCREGELNDGDMRIVSTEEISLGVYRHNGAYFAYRNLCVHQGGPACEGLTMPKVVDVIGPDRTHIGQDFDESEMHIVCPWHGYEYKLETGECVGNPRLRLRRFDVVEREGSIYVAL